MENEKSKWTVTFIILECSDKIRTQRGTVYSPNRSTSYSFIVMLPEARTSV